MKSIRIEEVGYTPGVVLDAKKGIFEMTGKACPEDAIEFYQPIIDLNFHIIILLLLKFC
jgi:hypothetical protein